MEIQLNVLGHWDVVMSEYSAPQESQTCRLSLIARKMSFEGLRDVALREGLDLN